MTSPRAVRSLDEALALALEDLDAGLSPLAVLERYPEYEADLAPLLNTAFGLRAMRWPVLSLAARVQGRERMHAALAQQQQKRSFILPLGWRQLGTALALVVLVALAGTTFMAWPGRLADRTNLPAASSTIALTPKPSATLQAIFAPTEAATRTEPPTVTPAREPTQPSIQTAEATATLASNRSVTRTVTNTSLPTRTRSASRTPSATPTPSPTGITGAAATVPVQQTPEGGLSTEAPPFTVTPAPTLTATATVTRPPKPSPTPTHDPTETPEPSPTWTLVSSPTATATRTPTVLPSDTPRPPTATPTVAPTATKTKSPTASATASPTRTATQTPRPTRTRRPTSTTEPTKTPESTKAPESIQTPEPPETRKTVEPTHYGVAAQREHNRRLLWLLIEGQPAVTPTP